MGNRVSKSTEYVKHVFTAEEKLKMGADLAASYTRLRAIDEEEQVVKAKFKERKSTTEQSIGSLSRDLESGWTMQNVECRLVWDSPNPFEVSYVRTDTDEVIKTRAMTDSERQMDLPLAGDVLVVPPDQSQENIQNFFNPAAIAEAAKEGEEPDPEPVEEPEDPFTSDDPDAAFEAIKSEHDAEFEGVAEELEQAPAPKPKAKRLRGFDGPTNPSAF